MTAYSSVNVNLPIEHVISKKPNRDNLEPPASVKMMFGFVNLSFTLILFHNDFEMQLHDAPESTSTYDHYYVSDIKLVGALMSLQFLQCALSLVNHHSNMLDPLLL